MNTTTTTTSVLLILDGSTGIVSNALIKEGTDFPKQICEDQGAPNCVKYTGYIQRGINILFVAIGFGHGAVAESSSNEQSSFEPGAVRRDLGSGFNYFTQSLGSALQESGFSYDSLDFITVPGLNFKKRDVESSLVSRLTAQNMRADDESSSSAYTSRLTNTITETSTFLSPATSRLSRGPKISQPRISQ
ncbi:uncharacterized protein ATNIH1004_009189 [Aspergillus tanneri]|uniref:Uncharacterized protein n=1 Tax=Aspergillus tanneri TaxID=1220188 RepID=A0A5M9MDF4_9EURO|nr:uncharacterized protein ATNIH1004_009189 [Aspergillus tanneri]KAA8644978.1 hypothetical protein ATNIH1004_009189 [Aspergillus tanneri]